MVTFPYIQYHNITMRAIIGAFLVTIVHSISFKIEADKGEKFCVYEVFSLNQKYSFAAASETSSPFTAEVQFSEDRKWNQVFMKKVTDRPFRARADKIASTSNMYMFCLTNDSPQLATFDFQLDTGLEVMELHELASETDSENLKRQITWLKGQTEVLEGRTNNIQGLRETSRQAAELIGSKMVFFAVLGLSVIAAVNFLFFRSLKKAFKERKLI